MTKRKSTAADGEKGTGASRENRKEERTVRERRSKGGRVGRRNQGRTRFDWFLISNPVNRETHLRANHRSKPQKSSLIQVHAIRHFMFEEAWMKWSWMTWEGRHDKTRFPGSRWSMYGYILTNPYITESLIASNSEHQCPLFLRPQCPRRIILSRKRGPEKKV